jgi:N-dimethylarginine dimethylaminohydrolase
MNAIGPSRLNEYGRLRRVAVRRPEAAMISQSDIDRQWRALNYHSAPEFDRAVREHQRLREILASVGAEIIELPASQGLSMDSLYVRDAALVCPKGLILCAMGKKAREGEPEVHGQALGAAGTPIAGRIAGEGRVEGGDVIWLDDRCAAIGRTYRTNDEGIRQFKEIVGPDVHVEVPVLPHYKGPSDVFHLMSIISPLDQNLQLVYSPLMPVSFREWLVARGQMLIEVPDEEFASMGCNVLAIAPREIVMVKGNPRTRARLIDAGCKVHVIEADAISVPGEGGPTCLTRPIERS